MFSAGFFLLQLEQLCSFLPPSVSPVTNAGVFLQGRTQQSRRMALEEGTHGRPLFPRSQLKSIWVGADA